MRSKICLILSLLFMCWAGALAQQTSKDQLIELAKSGGLEKLSPAEIKQKLKDLGISESDALQMAKDKGIDISKYIGNGAASSPFDTTGRGALGYPGGLQPMTPPATIQITAPTSPIPLTAAPIETIKTLMPDTSKIEKGANGLVYFGYEMFKSVPTAFEPASVGPVDPGYLVSPGDAIRLSVWGQAEFQYALSIDKEGRVFIPNVGQIFVAGTPLNQLQDRFKNQLSKVYAGLASDPPTVFLDATIDKLQPLRVFVMGEVKQPGGYTVSSYATVFNALYAVGGPLVKGSLRNIRVLRNSKVIATVDLYDYLLRGDQSSDVRLQNNDVIFVPPRGKSIGVHGEVFREATYELKDAENLKALLKFAGGVKSTAYLEHATVERVKPFAERGSGIEGHEMVDVNIADVIQRGKADIAMYDADEIYVGPVVDDKKNYVSIDGPVWRPDYFEVAKVPTVKKLIAAADGLQPKVYFPVAHIVRINEDLITRRIIPFNLGDVMDGTVPDIALQPRDEVHLYSTEIITVKERYVTINGEVKHPGKYPLRDNMTLSDLILVAGGYNQEAYLLSAEISRVTPEGLPGDSMATIFHPNLPKEFSKIASQRFADSAGQRQVDKEDFLLRHRDQVLITTNPEYKEQQNVFITGDIKFPGTYTIQRRGERLSQLLTRAGGPTTTSYLGGATFTRGGRRLLIDFEDAFYQKKTQQDVLMLAGDRIDVPSRPHTVAVNGEVNNPGLLAFIDGNSTRSYIDRAGGLTDSSNYALLIKPTGETQRVNFGFLRDNPEVLEGSTILVTKVPPPRPEDHFDLSGTIKDTFAVLSSAATLIFLIYQVSK